MWNRNFKTTIQPKANMIDRSSERMKKNGMRIVWFLFIYSFIHLCGCLFALYTYLMRLYLYTCSKRINICRKMILLCRTRKGHTHTTLLTTPKKKALNQTNHPPTSTHALTFVENGKKGERNVSNMCVCLCCFFLSIWIDSGYINALDVTDENYWTSFSSKFVMY